MAKKKQTLTSDDLTKRMIDWVSTALSIAMRWPRATALSGLGVVMLVIFVCSIPVLFPKKPLRHDDPRLQMMMNAVQQADQRVRSQMPGLDERDPEFRGVWDTLSDPSQSNVKESSP